MTPRQFDCLLRDGADRRNIGPVHIIKHYSTNMKISSIISTIFIFAVLLTSCESDVSRFGDRLHYNMSFAFQDAEGNDLSTDIERSTYGQIESPYKLDIILSKQSDKYDNEKYNVINPDAYEMDYNPPTLLYQSTEQYNYLTSLFTLHTGYAENQEMLTYQLTCPDIFGDNEMHIITTYWEKSGNKINSDYFFKCYKVEFDGQTITDIRQTISADDYYKANHVTLTVNR